MDESQRKATFDRGVPRSTWVRDDEHGPGRVHVKRFHDRGLLGRARDRRRAAAEFAALERLRERGLRVPQPLAIVERPEGVDLETRWIPGAIPLHDWIRSDPATRPHAPERVARAVGELLATAFEVGAIHPDLHSRNVVLDEHGDAHWVDVRGTRLRSGPLARSERVQVWTVLSADLREVVSDRWRARAWIASDRRAGPRDGPASRRREARALERAARARRRDVIERSAARWSRVSGAASAFSSPVGDGFVSRAVSRDAAELAIAAGTLVRVEGDAERVRGAWSDAARLLEHHVAVHEPVALVTRPRGIAFFDAHGVLRPLARASELDAAARARVAIESGRITGALFDRGLALEDGLEPSLAADEVGRVRVTADARLARADLDDAALALRVDASLVDAATRVERLRFLAAFRRAARLARDEFRTALRASSLRASGIADAATEDASTSTARDGSPRPAPGSSGRPEKLRRRVRARLLSGLARGSGFVPHPLVRAALTSISPLASWTRFEETTRANLELALGAETSPAQRARIARDVRRFAARQFSEWLRLSNAAPPDSPHAERGAWIEDAVELDASIGHLERELARGRGALIVTAHLGNWELLAARLRRAGHRGAVVGYRRPNDSSSRWLETMRRAYGVETLPQHENPRAILRRLQQGAIVGLLADLEVRRLDGEFLPFFGRPALTMTAPAALARANRSPLLPARCVFDARRGRYVLSFDAPLHLDDALPRAARALDLATRLNATFERWIRETPEQWAWHQPRWRTRPGEFEALPLHARRASPPASAAGADSADPRRNARNPGPSLQSPDQGLVRD